MTGFRYAIALAKDQHARLRLLNVVGEAVLATTMADPAVAMVVRDMVDSLKAAGRKVLDKACRTAEDAGTKTEAVQVPSRGQSVPHIILREAKRVKVTLIVMGSHGRRGINRLLWAAMRSVCCANPTSPVLLVRNNHRARSVASR